MKFDFLEAHFPSPGFGYGLNLVEDELCAHETCLSLMYGMEAGAAFGQAGILTVPPSPLSRNAEGMENTKEISPPLILSPKMSEKKRRKRTGRGRKISGSIQIWKTDRRRWEKRKTERKSGKTCTDTSIPLPPSFHTKN